MKRLFCVMVMAGMVLLMASPSYAVQFIAHLAGSNENPSNASPGTGVALVDLNSVAHTLSIAVEFSGLTAPTSDAHIHCCVLPPGNVSVAIPGVGAFPGFPLGVTSGIYTMVFDLTDAATFRPGFITNFGGGTVAGAEAALVAGLLAGEAYVNLHTTAFPSGEIRDFLQAVPEPGTLGLLATGIIALAVTVRRRRG